MAILISFLSYYTIMTYLRTVFQSLCYATCTSINWLIGLVAAKVLFGTSMLTRLLRACLHEPGWLQTRISTPTRDTKNFCLHRPGLSVMRSIFGQPGLTQKLNRVSFVFDLPEDWYRIAIKILDSISAFYCFITSTSCSIIRRLDH